MFKLMARISLISITSSAHALVGPSLSKAEFCEMRQDLNNVKAMTMSYENLMSFRNRGGIGNGGVCWWHSRFQRNALYLTTYNPSAPQYTMQKIISQIKQIRAGNEVVVINGFRNFSEFSTQFQDLIQRELERWQKADGIKKFRWVNGLKGKAVVSPEKMKEIVDNLYRDVTIRGDIVYQKLQVKGITAHAWLVVGMEKTPWGYNLDVVDSNIPYTITMYSYRDGDTNFNHSVYGQFTPYTDHQDELDTAKWVIKDYCKN